MTASIYDEAVATKRTPDISDAKILLMKYRGNAGRNGIKTEYAGVLKWGFYWTSGLLGLGSSASGKGAEKTPKR